MGHNLFLNFEKISIKVIEDNIKKMTNNNVFVYDEDVPDEINEEAFVKNLYHGSISITFIVNLFETTINTILSKRIGFTDEDILKMSCFSKLELICIALEKDYEIINGDNKARVMKEAIKLRNDITHYKNNEVGQGTFIPASATIPMGKSREPMAAEFSKDRMQYYYDNTINLIDMICQTCGYRMNNDCRIIDCDGRDDAYEFILG